MGVEDTEKNKRVFVLTIDKNELNVYVFRNKDHAIMKRDELLKEEYESYNDGKSYEGDDIVSEMENYNFHCTLEKYEIE